MSDETGRERSPLEKIERRILGVLVEKAMTTPDAYPLTANALVTGCNQKSNRDPVMDLQPHQVDEALMKLKEKGLVVRVLPAGGKTERWKHELKEAWEVDRTERAILAELLLRGPQTEGELRARASRMADIATLEDLKANLEQLARRGFVRRLSDPDRKRGVIWTHLLYSPAELEKIASRLANLASESEEPNGSGDSHSSGEPPAAPMPTGTSDRELTRSFQSALDELKQELAQQKSEIASLRQDLETLRQALGG